MSLAFAAKIGDMAPGNPNRVPNAASTLRKPFEFGIQHLPLLCAQDCFAHCVSIEGTCNGLIWLFEVKNDSSVVRQLAGRAAGSVINVVRLDVRSHQLSDHFTEVNLALIGGFKGGLDYGVGVFAHHSCSPVDICSA
ncbi:hypothetical protein [Stutzerimonas stutzeri]|uniref:hypothetical protein n=1 Tax=Stutzerimonas stutzeri TaxID=316 RepID=UPI001D0223C9|nr:hypothetical protein [Stutzerimonas stutzeri]